MGQLTIVLVPGPGPGPGWPSNNYAAAYRRGRRQGRAGGAHAAARAAGRNPSPVARRHTGPEAVHSARKFPYAIVIPLRGWRGGSARNVFTIARLSENCKTAGDTGEGGDERAASTHLAPVRRCFVRVNGGCRIGLTATDPPAHAGRPRQRRQQGAALLTRRCAQSDAHPVSQCSNRIVSGATRWVGCATIV